MPNYEETAETALRLIADAGRTLGMSRRVTTGDYDPIVGAPAAPDTASSWNVQAVVLPASLPRFRNIDNKLVEDGSLVLAKARYILAAAKNLAGETTPEPLPDDQIEFDGKKWRVAGCVSLSPAGIPLLYKIGAQLIN